MSTKIKIVQSPHTLPMEVAENILIKLHVPYSATNVTIQVAPNIQDYEEINNQPDIEIRQLIVSTTTEDTKTLNLNLTNEKKVTVNIENNNYEIELLNIGKENKQGQDYFYYEFEITKL